MPTTPTYALPYPTPTDPADVPVDLQELANATESALSSVTTGYQNADAAMDSRLDALEASPLAGVPPGSVVSFAGATVPTGWLICDGASYLRADYNSLFGVIGVAFGAADGTHFNVPDLRGRVAVGKGTHADVDALNDNDGLAIASRRAKHKHTVNDPGHVHNATNVYGSPNVANPNAMPQYNLYDTTAPYTIPAHTTGITIGPQTGAEPVDGPAYIVLNHIIKT